MIFVLGSQKDVAFCGTRVGELEFGNRVIRRVRVEGPVIRVIGIFEILNIRLHKPENDLFAAQEGVIEDCVVVNMAFAWDGLVGGREDRGRARTAARGGGE
jgi:hypothetical protein